MFKHKSLKCSTVQLLPKYEHLEVLAVDVLRDNLIIRQRFICAYRPPNIALAETSCLVECNNVLRDVTLECIICGDFNFPNIDWSSIAPIP